jgi:hypothetical protein
MNKIFIAALFVLFCLSSATMTAQTKNTVQVASIKDCCMMKDGKMMQLKDGKITKMKKSVTMADGTKCKCNGTCIKPDGTKIKLVEGNCVDNAGNIDNCVAKTSYTCTMHPQIVSGKPGKCLVCGMALVEKK